MLPKFCPISQGSSSDTGHYHTRCKRNKRRRNGSGDGTTDGGTTDVTPTTYADGTNGTAKSAVSTGDESPIGTMLALAAASVLAGGYVLIRRRKKKCKYNSIIFKRQVLWPVSFHIYNNKAAIQPSIQVRIRNLIQAAEHLPKGGRMYVNRTDGNL